MAINKCFMWKWSPGISLDFLPQLEFKTSFQLSVILD